MLTPKFLPNSFANPTTPSAIVRIDIGIFRRQFMALFAKRSELSNPRNIVSGSVSKVFTDAATSFAISRGNSALSREFVTFATMRSATLRSTASNVFLWRNCFKMLWIAAKRFMTQMVNLKTLLNRSYKQFVDDAMHCFGDMINADAPVLDRFGSMLGTDPHPAVRHWINFNFGLKTLWKSSNRIMHPVNVPKEVLYAKE